MNTSVGSRWLLVLALLLAAPAVADVRVAVSISGVDGKPRDNVRAALSLAQREGQLITLRTARDLHGAPPRRSSGRCNRSATTG